MEPCGFVRRKLRVSRTPQPLALYRDYPRGGAANDCRMTYFTHALRRKPQAGQCDRLPGPSMSLAARFHGLRHERDHFAAYRVREEHAPVLPVRRAARSIRAMVLYPGMGTHRQRRTGPHDSLRHRSRGARGPCTAAARQGAPGVIAPFLEWIDGHFRE